MRIGVLLMPTDPWPQTVARARQLEALGFHHLWSYDHLSWQRFRDQPWFAALPWLTGIAVATIRIRIGTMVASPTFRHPVPFAKELMTLDHVSAGRLTVGVGAGGTGFDATVLGKPVLTPGERAARLGDFVEVLDGMLRNDRYSTANPRYPVDEARMIPGCVQRPRVPLAIAAAGRKTLAVAARYGDAWISEGGTRGPNPTPADVEDAARAQSRQLDESCRELGRDPTALDRVFLVSNRVERPLASLDAFADFRQRCAALGFTDLVVPDPRPGDELFDDDPAVLEAVAREFLGSSGP